MKTTLFLHMGPGLNAQVERSLMQVQKPEILFWDQPVVQGAHAYDVLVQNAITQVDQLYAANQKPIQLMAHSFGGHLAYEILQARSHLVQDCVFYNTGYSTANGLHLLLHRLGADPKTTPDLKIKIAEFLQNNKSAENQKLWDYAALISQDSDFMRLYWPNANLYKKYLEHSQKVAPLHFGVFQDVLNSFYASPRTKNKSVWRGRLQLVLGSQDPLIDIQRDTMLRKEVFPQLSLVVKPESGHYSHLEEYLR